MASKGVREQSAVLTLWRQAYVPGAGPSPRRAGAALRDNAPPEGQAQSFEACDAVVECRTAMRISVKSAWPHSPRCLLLVAA